VRRPRRRPRRTPRRRGRASVTSVRSRARALATVGVPTKQPNEGQEAAEAPPPFATVCPDDSRQWSRIDTFELGEATHMSRAAPERRRCSISSEAWIGRARARLSWMRRTPALRAPPPALRWRARGRGAREHGPGCFATRRPRNAFRVGSNLNAKAQSPLASASVRSGRPMLRSARAVAEPVPSVRRRGAAFRCGDR
jgi:hypothetical protein